MSCGVARVYEAPFPRRVAEVYRCTLIPAHEMPRPTVQLATMSAHSPAPSFFAASGSRAHSFELTTPPKAIGSSEQKLFSTTIPFDEMSTGATARRRRVRRPWMIASTRLMNMYRRPRAAFAGSSVTSLYMYSTTPARMTTIAATERTLTAIFSWYARSIGSARSGPMLRTTTSAAIDAKLSASIDEPSIPAKSHGMPRHHRSTSCSEPKRR